jgi:hypothetical protein
VSVSFLLSGFAICLDLHVSEQEMVPKSLYGQVVAENVRLSQQLAVAVARIEDLEARLSMSSKNSSKPPQFGRAGQAGTPVAAQEVRARPWPADLGIHRSPVIMGFEVA